MALRCIKRHPLVLESYFTTGETKMNKDQVKGVSKDIAGKVQESAGKIMGSKTQQAKGLGKQLEGKSEKALGDARETIKDSAKKH